MRSTFIILTDLEDITSEMAEHDDWKVTSNCGMAFKSHYQLQRETCLWIPKEDLLRATKRKIAKRVI